MEENQKIPQLEDGYVRIANTIIDKLCKYRISGEEWQVLLVILRKTYGWNKKQDYISITQFERATGLKRANVYRAIKKLLSKKIIGIIKNDNSRVNLYYFNKKFDEWATIIKKDNTHKTIIKSDNRVLSKKITKVLSKVIPTKDIYKDNITKDRESVYKSLNYLINEEELKKDYLNRVFSKYNVSFIEVKRKAEELYNYCQAKGKRYKNYQRFLINALIRDFGYKFNQ